MSDSWLKRQMARLLLRRGYEIKEIGAPPRGFEAFLEYAKGRGLAPKTVFDVGVGTGTPWLYNAFPAAKLALFEPLTAFAAELEALTEKHGADLHRVALADREGVAEFNHNEAFPTSSSLHNIDANFDSYTTSHTQHHNFVKTEVPLNTLDNLNSYAPPYLLKIDVEGAELGVLQGAKNTLKETDMIIMEMSVVRRLAHEPSFAKMIAYLDECGFDLFDIPSLSQMGANGPLVYLDAAFVRRGHSLSTLEDAS